MRAPKPDTIVAVATPPGRGGIGVVRISGPRVPRIAEKLLGKLPQARATSASSSTGPPWPCSSSTSSPV